MEEEKEWRMRETDWKIEERGGALMSPPQITDPRVRSELRESTKCGENRGLR